jgi:DNA-binding phage protein
MLRLFRGKRSQTAFARRLGSRSNIAYTWESGRRFPTAAKAFWVAERCGIDVRAALIRFYRREPVWLADTDLTLADGVARLLNDLRGAAQIGQVAERVGHSRFAVARWFKGTAEPRLPDFLRMIEATSLRSIDFIAAFVDPEKLPALREPFQRLSLARKAAYELPWSHGVQRALELEAYLRLPKHEPGWIADQLGITLEEEQRCLELLAASHQIQMQDGRWKVREVLAVDTRQDPEAGKRLKAWWAEVGLERLRADSEGQFSFNLFTVSEKDYERIRELHLAYFRELRAIVAESEPAERVILANVQLVNLSGG